MAKESSSVCSQMDSINIIATQDSKDELKESQAHIWKHILYFNSSMALKCAIVLDIPDTIHKHGKPMTLNELAYSLPTPIHHTKLYSLRRLLRFLIHSKFFCKETLVNGEEAFNLTQNSQLMLKDHPLTFAPFALSMLDPIMTTPSHHLTTWLQNDAKSPFHAAHGRSLWEFASLEPNFNESFNLAMASDTQFVNNLLKYSDEFKGLMNGLESIVDVGGGNGAMAKGILEAYPHLKCIVFDLPHVVGGFKGDDDEEKKLIYVAGDMFEAVPPAQAVLVKWILHDWSDEDCLKILEKCKEAIPSKDNGGKVIIIDIVLQEDETQMSESQLLFDMHMMCVTIGGKERSEEEWRNIFMKAGFSEYKIFPILGSRSLIQVLPP